jgi:hypothetical protein
MGCTVFANDNGFFHKGSGGTGKAFPDVCLSPPPAPTGPVPVPYPNNLQASDLADGSKTVLIQGEPTALEDASNISTSTGDEAGNQGGGVVTHKTKGKGYFKLWSFDVKVEGKGVDRHDDPMGQNCSSTPFNGMDAKAQVIYEKAKTAKPCPKKYPGHPGTTPTQRALVNAPGPPPPACWECGTTDPGTRHGGFIADHRPPCIVMWYGGGCQPGREQAFKDWAHDDNSVKPHCQGCSSDQAWNMRNVVSVVLRIAHGLL